MSEERTEYQAGCQYDPDRAGQLHSIIAFAIDEFCKLHQDTLTSEIAAALDTVKQAYVTGAYGRVAQLALAAYKAETVAELEAIMSQARAELSESDYNRFLARSNRGEG